MPEYLPDNGSEGVCIWIGKADPGIWEKTVKDSKKY